ncbi:MAG: PIG-L family deacetylase [Chitinophagaceae bacterium]|nr:PIG-L family deacetylase [Chitinophagaceae bacterium]
MKKVLAISLFLLPLFSLQTKAQVKEGSKIRVIAIFAHPDDADSRMGGTAALFAKMGAAVKFVSLTNGDAGSYNEGGGTLAMRRREEARRAGERYGIEEYQVLDNHDGELIPDLNTRKQVIRAIREWDADIVVGLRPNDYHPDHRNAGKLVQDASFMVVVPNVVTDAPSLKKNPLFLYMADHFQKPNPFTHDIVIGIDETIDQKVAGLNEHVSQMYEWLPWTRQLGLDATVPTDSIQRIAWLKERMEKRSEVSPAQRAVLKKWYGNKMGNAFKYAESFEIAEYGSQPTEADIRRLFPMLRQ